MRTIFTFMLLTCMIVFTGCGPKKDPASTDSNANSEANAAPNAAPNAAVKPDAASDADGTSEEFSPVTTAGDAPLMEIQVSADAGIAGTSKNKGITGDDGISEDSGVSGKEMPLEEAIARDFSNAMSEAKALEEKDPEGASRAYQVLTADYPNRYEPYHRMALLAEMAKDYELAVALYEEAARKNPPDAAFYNDFGWYLYTVGEYAEAISKLRQANALAPDAPETPKYQMNLALALTGLGNYDEAFELMQKIPGAKAAASYCTLGAIQLKQALEAVQAKDTKKAEEKLKIAEENIQKALALDPELPEALDAKKFAAELRHAMTLPEQNSEQNSEPAP